MDSDTIDESPAPERRRAFLWLILGGIGVVLLVIAATILPRALVPDFDKVGGKTRCRVPLQFGRDAQVRHAYAAAPARAGWVPL